MLFFFPLLWKPHPIWFTPIVVDIWIRAFPNWNKRPFYGFEDCFDHAQLGCALIQLFCLFASTRRCLEGFTLVHHLHFLNYKIKFFASFHTASSITKYWQLDCNGFTIEIRNRVYPSLVKDCCEPFIEEKKLSVTIWTRLSQNWQLFWRNSKLFWLLLWEVPNWSITIFVNFNKLILLLCYSFYILL